MVEAALVTNDGKQNVLELLFPNSMDGGEDNPGVRYPYMAVGTSNAGYTQGTSVGLGQECQDQYYSRVELSASFGSDGTSIQLSGTFDADTLDGDGNITTHGNISTPDGPEITEVGIVNAQKRSYEGRPYPPP